MAYLSEMMVDLFGEEWLSTGRLELKFLRLIEVDDRIVAQRGQSRPYTTTAPSTWSCGARTQRGERVCAGTGRASAGTQSSRGKR